MLPDMDAYESENIKLIREIEGHVDEVSVWACMFEAMDQDTLAIVEIPSFAIGEAGRKIQRSVLRIQEVVGILATDLSS